MIYFVILFILVLQTYLYEHVNQKDKTKWPYAFIIISIIVLSVLSMCRGASGTDNLKFYKPFYYKYIVEGVQYYGKEYGNYWLCKLLYSINPSYEFELFGISVVIWSLFFIGTIKHDSKRKKAILFLTIFLFCFYLAPSFNIMRQTLAASVIYLSYCFLTERKPIKYVLCIIIATLFHTSAVVLLPMYFIVPGENRKGKTFKEAMINIGILLLPFIFIYSFEFLIDLSIFEKYKTFYGESISFDIRPTRLIARIPLYLFELYLLMHTKRKLSVKESFYGKLVILEAVSIFMGFYSTWAYRLMYYFSFGHPLFVMEKSIALNGKTRRAIFLICSLYFIVYFVMFHVILKYDEVFPYNP